MDAPPVNGQFKVLPVHTYPALPLSRQRLFNSARLDSRLHASGLPKPKRLHLKRDGNCNRRTVLLSVCAFGRFETLEIHFRTISLTTVLIYHEASPGVKGIPFVNILPHHQLLFFAYPLVCLGSIPALQPFTKWRIHQSRHRERRENTDL